MKVGFKESSILFNRKDLFLVVDSLADAELIDACVDSPRGQGTKVKIGLLSTNKITEDRKLINDSKELEKWRKDRICHYNFITPLLEVENAGSPEKSFNLIFITNAKIEDYGDWKSYLKQTFGKVYDVRNVHDLEKTLRNKVDDIVIYFKPTSVPVEYPDNMKMGFSTERGCFSLRIINGAMPFEVAIQTRSSGQNCDVYVEFQESTINGKLNYREYIETTDPVISNEELPSFKEHLSDWQKDVAGKKECPICGDKHDFYKPFYCKKEKETCDFDGKCIIKALDASAMQRENVKFTIFNGARVISSVFEIKEFEKDKYVYVPEIENGVSREVFVLFAQGNKFIKQPAKKKIAETLFEIDNDLYVLIAEA